MPDYSDFMLSLRAPSRMQKTAVAATFAVLLAVLALTAPFAETPFEAWAPFLPAYAAMVVGIDAVAAVLIAGQFFALKSPALLALIAVYVFDAVAAAAWALSFPGAFAEAGLLGGGLQTTAVIAAFRRLVFPLGILVYAALQLRDAHETVRRPGRVAAMTGVGAALAALLVIWAAIAGDSLAPDFMADPRKARPVWGVVLWASISLVLGAALLLLRRRRSLCVLDLWLLATLAAFLFEIIVIGFFGASLRFSLGWWTGRAFGLVSSGVVAIALLAETASLNARLSTALLAEKQARRSRTATLEALGAAIAHELNQPLGAIVTGANAATRWLDHPKDGATHVKERLAGIAEDGRRAAEILSGLRRTFGRHPAERQLIDAAELAQSAAKLARGQAAAAETRLVVESPETGTLVDADPEQIRQVILNLLANAFAALSETPRERRAAIIGSRVVGDRVVISVRDTGPGLDADMLGRVFEPFWTTRSGGMGLGLMICRTIVEAHGGRISAGNAEAGGALFEIELPQANGARA